MRDAPTWQRAGIDLNERNFTTHGPKPERVDIDRLLATVRANDQESVAGREELGAEVARLRNKDLERTIAIAAMGEIRDAVGAREGEGTVDAVERRLRELDAYRS